jgi:hypothetical protein
MGTSANIFESQLAAVRASIPGQHDFFFLDGQVEGEPLYGTNEEKRQTTSVYELTFLLGIDAFFPGPYYCFYELPTPEEIQDAHDLISETIDEEGPFDAIIGFSQGGALASSYILSDLCSANPRNPFKCAIFFCSSMPFDLKSRPFCVNKDGTSRFADTNEPIIGFDVMETVPEALGSNGWSGTQSEDTHLLHRYSSPLANPEKAQITIPTAHIVGATDIYRGQGEKLFELCATQGRHYLEHRGGHEIPSDRHTTSKMAALIHGMLQKDVLSG